METGETIVREFEDLFGLITMTERKWLVDRITALSPPEPTEPTEGQVEQLREAVRQFWIRDVNKPSWFSDSQNERLIARLSSALRAMPLQDHGKLQSPKMRAETTPEMLESARRFVLEKPSTSYLQRKLMISYNHACEIMEHFEVEGLVSALRVDGKRVVLAEGQISGAKP